MKIDFSSVLSKDLYRLQILQRQISKPNNKNYIEEKITEFEQLFKVSNEKFLNNLKLLPKPKLSADLPVLKVLKDLKKLIETNQIIIVSGETGSGKTTQLPQICLALGLGARGKIAHTQPRRIAARSVAARIAEELEVTLGNEVGYQVRFDEKFSAQTYIKVMTDGMLLAETNKDKFLSEYEVIIVDEAHERSLNIDFLLGYLKNLCQKRKDLKVIITSATIDAEKFSKHFNNAPQISVSGRSYPVEIRYQEPQSEQDLNNQILDALNSLPIGDVLIFFPTEREILETATFLEREQLRETEILPLFGRLSLASQQAVFNPKNKRRIVLTTNVAETSLTVPRIKYVIDTGTARISRYSLRTKTQRLPIEPISQASANQRAGRCGRLSAGICIRLFSAEDFSLRPEFTEPEILRTNLAAIILQMLVLKLGDISNFPFVDMPDHRQINDGYRLLYELKAVDTHRNLTPLGRKMAKLPIDPRFARIVFAAEKLACIQEALIILAFLSIQDPRERPFGHEAISEQRQGEFCDSNSDFQTVLNLFFTYQKKRHELSNKALTNWCKQYFLNASRMREWRELVNQLIRDCREQKLRLNKLKPELIDTNKAEGTKGRFAFKTENTYALHEALLSGFLDQIGLWDEQKQDYLGTRGRRFRLFPASVLAKKRPATVMAASIVETQQTFARICAPINFSSVERQATHLTKSQLHNPHWSKKMGNVMAEETITLYGLPLISGRKKPFNDNVLAQQIFIEEGLITGEINTRIKAVTQNLKLIEQLESLEDKTRNRGILDERAISAFYQQRLPEHIHSVVELEKWVSQNGEESLVMSAADLLYKNADTNTEGYPEFLYLHGYRLPLQYEFDPSSNADGITVAVPITALNVFTETDFERLVPAMLHGKIEALLRRLPKIYRRQLVPIPDFAHAVHKQIHDNQQPLIADICAAIRAIKGLTIPEGAFDLSTVEAHHFMNIRLIDGKKTIAESRNLRALQQQFSTDASDKFQNRSQSKLITDEKITSWQWDSLPVQERLVGGIIAYPALTQEKNGLFLRLHDNAQRAQTAHRQGLLQLLSEHLSSEIKYLRKNLPHISQLNLIYRKVSNSEFYADDLIKAAVEFCCLNDELPRTRTQYDQALNQGKKNLVGHCLQLNDELFGILNAYNKINESLRGMKSSRSKDDLNQQISKLVYPHFIRQTNATRFKDLTRYLKAAEKRLEKIKNDALRDWRGLNALEKYLPFEVMEYDDIFWLIQEYRVQLFAQEIGTAVKVSPKILDEKISSLKLIR